MSAKNLQRKSAKSLPKYRLHKARGCGVVTIAGRNFYLGAYDSPESYEKYARLIAEWKANFELQPSLTPAVDSAGLLVLELVNAYRKWAEGYYLKDGKPTSQIYIVRQSLKPLCQKYASTTAAQFSPLALRALQQALVDAKKSRRYVNQQISIVKHMFKWAAFHELVPVTVFQALMTVPGLRRGRTEARETKPIQPVDDEIVEATLQQLPKDVADMVRFQRLVGCRPGEVCSLRPCDADVSGEVWCYTPESHKTQHHGRHRRIYIGPRGQDVLRPYLLRDKTTPCFCPIDSEKHRRAERRENRKTPVQPSQQDRRKPRPKTAPTDGYTKDSYGRAIKRAAEKADKEAKERAQKEGETVVPAQRLVPHWHPNQLRHSVATAIRRQYGIEAAQTVLGHSEANVTEIYAERDFELAARVMKEVG